MNHELTGTLPREVVRTRSLIGAWAAVSVLQYFLAEAIVISAWAAPQPYSRRYNLISDLGAVECGIYRGREVCSPLHGVMNASFLLQGSAMIIGAALVSTVVLGVAARRDLPATVIHPRVLLFTRLLIAASGAGTILIGLFPEDVNEALHYTGAVLFFTAGGIALVIIGWSWRRLHWTSWLIFSAGALSLASTIAFGVVTLLFGLSNGPDLGTLERAMAYPITIGLAIVGGRIAVGVHRARATARAEVRLAATAPSVEPPRIR
ncbi:MAG TPA: DUF998 domain-containing protein [Glaciibacter sp.]|nr:DUF998 domain-containing protein [Glaciibacter sp.]